MNSLIYILSNIIQPIFIIILIGYFIQRKFELHIPSFSKIQIYVLLPSLVFKTLYFSDLKGALVGKIIVFNVIFFCLLIVLSTLVAKAMKLPRPKEKAFVNAVSLRNIGNYGIPLVSLLYANTWPDLAMSVHMISVITCVVLMYTIGLYNASSGHYGWRDALKNIMKIPIIYVIIIASLLKVLGLTAPSGIVSATSFLGGCVAPLALFTLGAQLANTHFKLGDLSLHVGNFLRLIISPIMAYFLSRLMGLDHFTTSLMVLGAATPTAVNSLFMAIEFNGDADYASQSVFFTTLLSALTVTGIIYVLTPMIY